jgi:hypothetical protein
VANGGMEAPNEYLANSMGLQEWDQVVPPDPNHRCAT